MSLTAAASGFIVFFLSVQVIQLQDGWGVTYTSTEICAVQGSTVEMSCSYRYPSTINVLDTIVERSFWFKLNGNKPVDVRTDAKYAGRVQHRCHEKSCTLRITDLRKRDSAVYRFRFVTKQPDGRYTGFPGVTLSVADPALKVQVRRYSNSTRAELRCHSSCRSPDQTSYVWYKNGRKIQAEASSSYSGNFNSADSYSCAVNGREDSLSPPVYAPKVPSLSVSPSAEIVEGTSVTLTCSSDANPAAKYTWYKENVNLKPVSEEPQLVFRSIQSSDAGEYYCTAENKLGRRTSGSVSVYVTYAPKLLSVSVSPSAEIVEGTSVTLTCSSDANPAAKYTWYKENQKVLQGPTGRVYHFTSISSEDKGIYYCTAENQYGSIYSSSLFVDVEYAPKLPSVSVSPSAEIVEGSSVNLTCSSDANPAANYTWYKEDEDSPKASGQMFTITNIRAEHSGNYYCEAQNRRGRHNSTLHLIVVAVSPFWNSTMIISIVRLTLAVMLPIPLLLFCLWMRKKKTLSSTTEPNEPIETVELEAEPVYMNVPPVN